MEFTTLTQVSLDIGLQLRPNPCPTSNGMTIIAVVAPVSGLFKIAFVEFTHNALPINENRESSAGAPRRATTLSLDERPALASSWRLYNPVSVTALFQSNPFFVIFCNCQ